jgi:hypothetical protein
MIKKMIKTLVMVHHTIIPGTSTWRGMDIFPLQMMTRSIANPSRF